MADLVVRGAVVHTMDPSAPRAEAFAVRDGAVVAVGAAHEAEALIGPGTRVVDLAGSVVLPGLIDVHNHHAVAGEADLHHLRIAPEHSLERILAAVRDHVAGLAPGAWVAGGSWGSHLLAELSDPAARRALDAASAGHPVVLVDDTHHNRWANTLALRAAGILDSPAGLLFESAGTPVERALAAGQSRDTEWYARNSERGVRLLHQHGVTAFQDAATDLHTLGGLRHLDDHGRLRAWVVSSMLINDQLFGAEVVGEELLARAGAYATRHHRPAYGKIFLDGVPMTRTGAFLEPYLADEQHGDCFRGHSTMDPAELGGWLRRAGRLGLGLKIHCTGDASARMVLDAVAKARAAGQPLGPVQIAHGQYLHPDDVPRFAELGVINDMSPALWFPNILVDAMREVRSEPSVSRPTPARTLLDTGALVAGGSDWPVAPTPNPWLAISSLVTRRDPTGRRPGTLWPEQAITMPEAIAACTRDAARAIGVDDVAGALAPGRSADFVVLDRDPFTSGAEDVARTVTRQTWFAGEQVYSRD